MDLIASFSSASGVWPVKVLRRTPELFVSGRIVPYHLQLSLTNRCNLNCVFCSCADRDKGMELDAVRAMGIIDTYHRMGMRAVTITGGGEPLLHPGIEEILSFTEHRGIKIGLVTNGFLLDRIHRIPLQTLTWCRVSVGDDRDDEQIEELFQQVRHAVDKAGDVDWAFSYVVTRDFVPAKLRKVICYSNELKMTHVRVVSDLVDLEGTPDMLDVREYMREDPGLDLSRVLFQGRKVYTAGAKRCWISLLKPTIGTDGKIYPCCGVQYARPGAKDFNGDMSMGGDYEGVFRLQVPFDGSACEICYYEKYNRLLETMMTPLVHEEFV